MTVRKLSDEYAKKQSFHTRVANVITTFAGSMNFVYLHALVFTVWIGYNLWAHGVGFDPFPFGLLTMIVSLEAIFLSTFVMISQNLQADKADLRAELDYEVNVKAEKEIGELKTQLKKVSEQLEPFKKT